MSYKAHTFNFDIGDTGVSQSDDGTTGTLVNIDVTLEPPTGWTIVNVASITPQGGAVATSSASPPSDDATTPWSVAASADFTDRPYPMASETLVYQVTCILGEGFLEAS